MKKAIFLIITFYLILIALAGTTYAYYRNNFARELWSKVQRWRVENNLQPYTLNESLCEVASMRTEEIKNYWSHDNNTYAGRVYGRTRFRHSGENLARNYLLPSSALQAWLNSPSHLENLLDDYTHSCIECSGTYCVQLFAKY